MTELKRMTDQELANRMVGYITRVEKLMDDITAILQKGLENSYSVSVIRNEYKCLKIEIKDDAHYLGLSKNERNDSKARLYNAFFDPSIREASAYGFSAPTNNQINDGLYNACEDAHDKLTKYYRLSEWKIIAEGEPV